VVPLALFRIVPFAPFRIGGELGVSPLPGELAVRQELPLSSVVFALLIFVLACHLGSARFSAYLLRAYSCLRARYSGSA
jgi:hypothetical protein